jgi:serine O-acetyltransferase
MNKNLKYYLDHDWAYLNKLAGKNNIERKWHHAFHQRFAPVVLIRLAHFSYLKGYIFIAKLFSLLNFLIFSIEVSSRLKIGPGLVIPHPQGTVLGASEIGSNVVIFHQVTLGAKHIDFNYDISLRPIVCDGVTISVGAKVLGGLTLGVNCMIGANAVVLDNVPAGATAVGIPAKIINAINYE